MTHIYAKNDSDLFRHPVIYGYYQEHLMLSTELIVTLKQNFTEHKNVFKTSSGGTRISQPGVGGDSREEGVLTYYLVAGSLRLSS